MGLIIKEYTVTGNRNTDTVTVLYDTELRDSFVRNDIAEKLGDAGTLVRPTQFVIASGRGKATADRYISLDMDVDGTLLYHWFYVVDGLDEELVVGADMIRKWKINLDLDNETVSIDPRAESLVRRTGIAIPVPVSGE